jgi:hypothetical protein
MNSYVQLINNHRDENCFIFGAGPSLWHNMHEPFFREIPKRGITIAVNSAVLAVPNFDYWVSNDSLCMRWSWWEDVKNGKGIKVVRNSWEKYKEELDDFLYFEPRPTPEDTINPGHIGLAYCSSVPSSIDLAIQMGCKKIFLLGVDQNAPRGKHHFWQYMDKQPVAKPPAQGPWEHQKKVFDFNNKAYDALSAFAKAKGVDIYNISWVSAARHWSKVKNFKRIEMCDVKKLLL